MKKEKEDKKTFKELWADTRYRALIKLGMWVGFFVLMFMISFIVSLFNKNTGYKKVDNNDKVIEEKVETNMTQLLRNLKTSEYSYKYIITNGDIVLKYNGTREKKNESGYFESSNGIIKYEVKDGIYYRNENEELIEDPSIMSDIDKDIIDINNLVKKIYDFEDEEKSPVINENIYTYDFSTESYKYVVNITKNANSISGIEIDYNDIKYNLEYKTIVE